MQSLFLNIVNKSEKQSNWNTYTCPPLEDEPLIQIIFDVAVLFGIVALGCRLATKSL